MEDMFKFEMPKNQSSIIKVLGVGGGGSNAVNHMMHQGISGVDFIICNTDAQALDMSPVPNKIQIGSKGLGAGSDPSVAEKAAIEKAEEIKKLLETNTEMLFITAGMGGGTGTGAAPVIAKLAKEIQLQDDDLTEILVVAIVTLPFNFEGRKRKKQAMKGIEEIRKYADAVLIISNDKLRETHGNLGLSEAFKIADNVLLTAAKGIAEIITVKAYVNIDFKDVNTVMKRSGVAIMGNGIAEGENRALEAISTALSSPLLNDNDIKGTNNILLYLSSGAEEISMDEITEITDYIIDEAGPQVDVIWGAGRDESLENKISVTIIATGFDKPDEPEEDNRKKFTLYREENSIEEKSSNSFAKPIPEESNIETPRPTRPAVETILDEEEEEEPEEIQLISRSEEPKSDEHLSSRSTEEKPNIIRFNLDDPVPETKGPKISLEVNTPVDEHDIPEPEEFTFKEEMPLFKKTTEENPSQLTEENIKELEKKSKEREEKLRQMSLKLRSVGGLSELESQPAFKRKNVELTEEKPSEETKVSKFTLSDDGENGTELKSDNSFLHDNVD